MIKAIETVYNGYRFRSRLEARWAIFFDMLDIRFNYEPEGFELGDGIRYLPDFWLPEQKCFVEIKPQSPSAEEQDKCLRLARRLDNLETAYPGMYAGARAVFMFAGEVPAYDFRNGFPLDWHIIGYFPDGTERYSYAWAKCMLCGAIDLAFNGCRENLPCNCARKLHDFCVEQGWDMSGVSFWGFGGNTFYKWEEGPLENPILKAFNAARQARFEHGEQGASQRGGA